MPKDTFYFSHDYNARNDRKIAALVKDFKSSGYGIFWATCELMHEEGGSLEFDNLTIGSIAKDLNEEENVIKSVLSACVEKYKLFTKQDFLLRSNRISQNLDTRNTSKQNKAEAGRLGGIRSGESRRYKRSTKQNEAERSNASSNEAKERKGKEIKERKEDKEINKEKWNTMPTPSDLNGLPEIKVGSVIQMLYIMQHVTLKNNDVMGMWEVFKEQSLTGQKYYQAKDDVYSHFINWMKGKKFEQQKNGEIKMVY